MALNKTTATGEFSNATKILSKRNCEWKIVGDAES